ncbi:MAG: hypothetical protein PG981_001366 [Wolbachia endosymbiont of Ctenocephalides orientis wCori]|nr:MAG: hypothetical protein PG981_001366 [Wolbachia endosymbiont of Ctenocephalides orientis wCori]
MDTEVIYSGIVRRIVAYTVDSILLFIMTLILGVVIFLAVASLDTNVQRSDVLS